MYGNARVYGDADVSGSAVLDIGADVFEAGHVVVIDGFFPSSVTVYRTR